MNSYDKCFTSILRVILRYFQSTENGTPSSHIHSEVRLLNSWWSLSWMWKEEAQFYYTPKLPKNFSNISYAKNLTIWKNHFIYFNFTISQLTLHWCFYFHVKTFHLFIIFSLFIYLLPPFNPQPLMAPPSPPPNRKSQQMT